MSLETEQNPLDPRVTGSMGGKTRAQKLSKKRRVEIATKASLAAKKKREEKERHAQKNY